MDEDYKQINADWSLEARVRKIQKSSFYVLLVTTFTCVLAIVLMYFRDSGVMRFFNISVITCFLAGFFYLTIISEGRILSRCITEIIYNDQNITFKTVGFSFLHLINFKSVSIQFSRSQFDMSYTLFPKQNLMKVSGKVLKVNYNDSEYYILNPYFEVDIEKELRSLEKSSADQSYSN